MSRVDMSEVAKTEEWEQQFLDAYLTKFGVITHAARAVGVTPDKVKTRAASSPEFREKLDAAREVVKDTIRYEVIRRAIEPVEKPIYQRGEFVGVVEEWDNKHLEWVAERLMPSEFHIPTRVEFAGDGDGAVSFKLELGSGQAESEEDGKPE